MLAVKDTKVRTYVRVCVSCVGVYLRMCVGVVHMSPLTEFPEQALLSGVTPLVLHCTFRLSCLYSPSIDSDGGIGWH